MHFKRIYSSEGILTYEITLTVLVLEMLQLFCIICAPTAGMLSYFTRLYDSLVKESAK